VFTTAPHSSLSRARCIQFTHLHLISLISIFFASDSSTKSTDAFLFSAVCARCPARHVLLDTSFKNSIQLKLIISKGIPGSHGNPSRSVLPSSGSGHRPDVFKQPVAVNALMSASRCTACAYSSDLIICKLSSSCSRRGVVAVKADSHIACRAHAAPMPFPCHAMPLRV
jgi:hypothetical protein